MEIKKEEDVTFTEAKRILEKKAGEKELGYEQNNALEHLKKFSKLSSKRAREMAEDLEKSTRLKERQIINVVNLLPEDLDDLRVLFAHEVVSLSEEDKKKILSIVKKYS